MAIGPIGPLLKNDGPACRVCGCTENNACVELRTGPTHFRSKVAVPRTYVCSWVKVEGATEPLCSACSGTEGDLADAIKRVCRHIEKFGEMEVGRRFSMTICKAALARRKSRQQQQGKNRCR